MKELRDVQQKYVAFLDKCEQGVRNYVSLFMVKKKVDKKELSTAKYENVEKKGRDAS